MNDILIDILVEYLQSHLSKGKIIHYGTPPVNRTFKPPVEAIICKDGTKLSIQASKYHYCLPKSDTGPWSHVEVMVQSNTFPICFEKEGCGPSAYVPIEAVAEEILLRNKKNLT